MRKQRKEDVAPEAPAKKVSPLKGRKLGPRKKPSPLKGRKLGPSPLKGRKLGPRKPKVGVVPLSLLEVARKVADATQPKKAVFEGVDKILQERAQSYGTFVSLAKTAQEFKSVLYRELGSRNKRLADDQAEALDMIIHKIARVINGDANHVDSWADIAGYATLVAERLQGRTL